MKYIKRLMVLLALLLPTIAMAQTASGFFQPTEGSKAMVTLASVFGKLGVFGANGGDPFFAVIQMFNGAVLVIGGFLVAYNLFLGQIGTAHDGEVMGKKIHSVWMPLRTALGTAMVLPIVGGGYCLMQLLVGWAIVNSIGLADKVWATYVSDLPHNLPLGIIRIDTKQMGYTLLQNHVCIQSFNKAMQTPEAQTLGGNNSNFGISMGNDGENIIYKFGDTNETNGFNATSCGSVKVPDQQTAVVAPAVVSLFTPTVIRAESDARMQRIVKFSVDQFTTLNSQMQSFASSLVNGGSVSPASIDQAIANYEMAIKNNASNEIMNIDAFKEVSANASQDGFFGMATFYQKLVYLGDLIQRTMAKVPVANPPAITASPFKDQYAQDYAKLQAVLSQTKKAQAFGVSYELGGSNSIGDASLNAGTTGDYDFNKTMKNIFSIDPDSWVLTKDEHPVSAVKRLGNGLLETAGVAYVAGEVLSFGAYNLKIGPYGIGEPLSRAIQSATEIVCLMLISSGFVLSYLIPFTPTVIIISAIIGWAIACIEGVIIAPLWAVMHLTAGGDDMVGSGKQGYRLLLNLLLKPVLLVFGVIASIALLPVFGNLIAMIFNDTFRNMNQDSNFFIYACSLAFQPFVYGALVYMVIKRLFNVIVELPDQIMKWITNSDNVLGSSASQIAGGSGGGVGGYEQVATGAVAGTAKAGMNMTAGVAGYMHNREKATAQYETDQKMQAMDAKVLEGLKTSVANGELTQEEAQVQAETYGALRQQFRNDPEMLNQAHQADNLSELNNVIQGKPQFFGKQFQNVAFKAPLGQQ